MPASENFPPPTKIICVGRNYVAHIEELNNAIPDEPVLFIKPPSAISDQLHATHNDEELHYEAELCFVIKAKQLAGVGLGLDLTKRASQSTLKAKGLPWERAKAFDTSAVFTDFVSYSAAHPWQQLRYTLHIDDALVQSGDPNLMMYNPDQLLDDISRQFSLCDGDIIMTGTPAGVGVVSPGKTYTATLSSSANEDILIKESWIAL